MFVRGFPIGAFAVTVRAACGDLQVLGNEFQSVFFCDGASVPIHERCVEFDDFVAVVTDDVPLERSCAARAFVVFEIAPDVELADDSAGNKCGNGAVNGGA